MIDKNNLPMSSGLKLRSWYPVRNVDNVITIQARRGGAGDLIASMPVSTTRGPYGVVPTDNNIANSNLMAASPKMLDTLLKIKKALRDQYFEDMNREHLVSDIDEAISEALFGPYNEPIYDTRSGISGSDNSSIIIDKKDFENAVRNGLIRNGDGYGFPMKDGKIDFGYTIFPSDVNDLPKSAEQIAWRKAV